MPAFPPEVFGNVVGNIEHFGLSYEWGDPMTLGGQGPWSLNDLKAQSCTMKNCPVSNDSGCPFDKHCKTGAHLKTYQVTVTNG